MLVCMLDQTLASKFWGATLNGSNDPFTFLLMGLNTMFKVTSKESTK